MASGSSRTLARLHKAASAIPITDASLRARLITSEYVMEQAAAVADLQHARGALEKLGEFGGPSSIRALVYLRALDRLKVYSDSVHVGAPEGDMATFVVAETVRDSLTAPRIAAELFAAVPAGWPTSPYAPKALLALASLLPQSADSIHAVLETSYAGSPYLALVAGEVTPAALALEDSLQAYASKAVPSSQVDPGARRVAPSGPTKPGARPPSELK